VGSTQEDPRAVTRLSPSVALMPLMPTGEPARHLRHATCHLFSGDTMSLPPPLPGLGVHYKAFSFSTATCPTSIFQSHFHLFRPQPAPSCHHLLSMSSSVREGSQQSPGTAGISNSRARLFEPSRLHLSQYRDVSERGTSYLPQSLPLPPASSTQHRGLLSPANSTQPSLFWPWNSRGVVHSVPFAVRSPGRSVGAGAVESLPAAHSCIPLPCQGS